MMTNPPSTDENEHLLGSKPRPAALSYDEAWPEYGASGANGAETTTGTHRPPRVPPEGPKKPKSSWQSLDVYQSLANVARHPSIAHEGYYNKRSCFTIFWRMVESIMVLAATGVLTGFITLAANVTISYFSPMGLMIVDVLRDNIVLACIVFTIYVVILSLCSVVVTNNICPEAIGGGIPDVKTVLSGLISRPVLSVRLIFAKMLGLVFALVAGLSVGKEGPFVHVAVAVSDSLMRLNCFRHCRRNISKRLEILGCACAAGVASTFGTPFAGVLFSIEVTATCYMVRNLPRAFLTAVCASLVYNLVGLRDTFSLFREDNDKVMDYSTVDLLLSIALGVVSGLLGAVYVAMIQGLCVTRNKLLRFSLGSEVIGYRRFMIVLVFVSLISPIIFLDVVYGLHGGTMPLTDYLFNPDDIGVTWPLICYVPFKFIVTIICISLPLPVGLFTPTFTTGGAMGRLYGEMIATFPRLAQQCTFAPWEFAFIGAAAFSTGVTRAISTAVIVFELSGQSHLHLPMSIAILAAYFIANRFTKNVYDVILDTNGVPIMPELPAELYMISAAQVMKPMEETPFLTLESTFEEAEEMICRCTDPLIPVVDSAKHMGLQGAVLVEDLKNVVNRVTHLIEEGNFPHLPSPRAASFSPDRDHHPSTPTGGSSAGGGEGGGGGGVMAPMGTRPPRKQVQFRPMTPPVPSSSPGLSSSSSSSSLQYRSPRPPRAPQDPRQLLLNFVVLKDRDLAVSLTPKRLAMRTNSVDVIMDPSPYQIADSMILSKVDLCFRMLKLSQAYVVRSGRLVGVLTRDRLTDFLGGREKRPMDRCMQLAASCFDCLCCRRRTATPRTPRSNEPVPYHRWPSDEDNHKKQQKHAVAGTQLQPQDSGTIQR